LTVRQDLRPPLPVTLNARVLGSFYFVYFVAFAAEAVLQLHDRTAPSISAHEAASIL